MTDEELKAAADQWVDENTEYDTIDELLADARRPHDERWREDARRYFDEMKRFDVGT